MERSISANLLRRCGCVADERATMAAVAVVAVAAS